MDKPENNPVAPRPRNDSEWLTLAGREIGDFEIVREIGRGGMGTVFQARQKSLDRVVALKVLAQGLATTSMSVVRFQREAQAAARLHHSNIIPIHALGDHEGIYYYAMELVHGENLHDSIARERLQRTGMTQLAETKPLPRPDDPEATVAMAPSAAAPRPAGVSDSHLSGSRSASAVERATYFDTIARRIASVADALDYAHRNGVIHRDVKPHNLIVSEDGRIHIFDFGLARVLEQPGVTMTGEFIGSPLYMSPEQIMGGQVRVDKRTDIYSLGATLYEWLTLSPPFPGETREQVISKIITSELPLAREHDPHIPLDLETICLKCLEKSPDRRYQSAGDLRDDLMRFVERENIRARRAGPLVRARKFIFRHRVAAVVTMAVMVAGVLVAALFQQARKSRGKEDQIAELHEQVKAKEDQAQDRETERDRLQRMLAFGEDAGKQLRSELGSAVGQLLSPGTEEKSAIDPLAEQTARALLGWLREEERRNPPAEVGPKEAAAQDLFARALTSENLADLDSLAQEFTRLNPNDLRGAKLSAAVCCVRQNVDCMMTHAATVMAAEPQRAGGYLFSGVAKMLAGNMSDSLDNLNRAVDLAPDSTWPLTLRGFARRRTDDFVNAIRDLSSAVRLSQGNSLAIFEKSRISAYLEDYDSAIAGATRLIELDPKNVEAYVFRGECHDAKQDYAASQADYQQAIALGGGSVIVVYKLGMATMQLKNQPKGGDSPDTNTVEGPQGQSSQPTTNPESAPPPRRDGGGSANAADRDSPGRWADRPLTHKSVHPGAWPMAVLLGSRPR